MSAMRGIATAAVVVLLGTAVAAHHSHPDFLLSQSATVAGTIENILWKNGHSVLTLRTADSTVYTAEWQSANWLYYHTECVVPVNGPVARDTLKVGDFIVVVGAPPKDPTRHELVNLRQVSRPLDQWRWVSVP